MAVQSLKWESTDFHIIKKTESTSECVRLFPLNLVENAKLAICLSYKIRHVYAAANSKNARLKVIAHASPNLLYKLY